MGFNRGQDAQRGQAMVETILVIALVSIVAGLALRALGGEFVERQANLESYYSLPFP